MTDVETGSLWSHILGECMDGARKGAWLESLPSVMATWGSWRAQHPGTTVLNMPRTSRDYDRKFYSKPERFVLGIVLGGVAKAYPFDMLRAMSVIQETIAGEPVLVIYDAESTQASVFSRTLGAETLDFLARIRNRTLRDARTGSVWDPKQGRATAGPLAGQSMRMMASIVSYRGAWEIFHPDSLYAKVEGQTDRPSDSDDPREPEPETSSP
ncbi:MAG: DUF3179 domain-containing (seleno)protein [Planctomycetota bacterium]